MLANTIRSHCSDELAASNWPDIAAKLNRRDQVRRLTDKASGKQSFVALLSAGLDPNTIIASLRAVPIGSELMDTLTASGVDWTDALTLKVLRACGVDETAIAALRATIESAASLVEIAGIAEVTAEQCKQVIDAESLRTLRDDLRERFDAIINQIGSVEQAQAASALRAMANELEAG